MWLPALALAVLACPLLSSSSQAATTDVVPGSDPVALALLSSAVRAETGLTYGGVEVVGDADAADDQRDDDQVIDVSHVVGQGTVMLTAPTGTGTGTGTGSIVKGSTRAGFIGEDVRRPQLLVDLLQRSYRVLLAGDASVAGRTAHVVVAESPDGRVAARFWVDEATGLLLRRDVLDRSGRTASSFAFSRLSLDGQQVAYLPPLIPGVHGASLDQRTVAAWAARGWPCPEELGGLTLFDVRTVTASGAAGTGATAGTVLHLTYSDGLSTVSVFAQQGRLDASALPGARAATVAGQRVLVVPGHPRQLVWGTRGFVLTVVADAGPDVVDAVVRDLPRPAGAPTGWARVERGLARVVSWVDPFD